MGACGKVGSKRSTCLYIDGEALETAKRMGLNASKVSENALVEAIRRLRDPKGETGLRSRPRLEGTINHNRQTAYLYTFIIMGEG